MAWKFPRDEPAKTGSVAIHLGIRSVEKLGKYLNNVNPS